MEGNVERRFIFTTILSTDVIPFGFLKQRLLVLPLMIKKGKVELISSYNQPEIMTLGLASYLEKAEREWREHATPKSKRMTIYDRLNFQNGVVNQNPNTRFRVLYKSSFSP